jgi:glutamate racemase
MTPQNVSHPTDFPIGIFDSGVGGLSVLRWLWAQLPYESFIYLADQAHVPYGQRPLEEIRRLSKAACQFLLSQGAKLIVVACNTASGAALSHLREEFPRIPIVGMEPAVKPAAELTKTGKVGVLATTGTFESQRYVQLMRRWASEVKVLESPCPGLVERIEAGDLESTSTERLLRECLGPMLEEGVDTVVLGCTHYPLVICLIERIAGDAVTIIDPAPAVARQTERVLLEHALASLARTNGGIRAFTSGHAGSFSALAAEHLSQAVVTELVSWQGGRLITA